MGRRCVAERLNDGSFSGSRSVKATAIRQPGYYADGGNLYLRVAPGGTKGWIFRFALAGQDARCRPWLRFQP